MRGTFDISSLEEDLKDLGILDVATPAPVAAAAPAGELTEKFRLTFKGKKATRTKVKRQSSAARAAGRRQARKGSVKAARKKSMKKKMRSSKFRRVAAMKRRISHKMHGESIRTLKRAALAFVSEARGFMETRHPGTVAEAVKPFVRARTKYGVSSHLAEELADLQRITSQVAAFEAQDVIKGFANIALIAEQMVARFEALAEVLQDHALDEEMRAVAEVYAQLAEDAAHMAKGLHESDATQFDFAGLTEAFRSQMRLLLQGLDIYGDLTDGPDGPAAEDDEDESDDEDDDEESDEDDDEESDEDDDEESDEDDDEEDDAAGEV